MSLPAGWPIETPNEWYSMQRIGLNMWHVIHCSLYKELQAGKRLHVNDSHSCVLRKQPGFYLGNFGGGGTPQIFGTPPRSFGQVYSGIKNPVIAVIKLAAVIQVQA